MIKKLEEELEKGLENLEDPQRTFVRQLMDTLLDKIFFTIASILTVILMILIGVYCFLNLR